MTVLFFISLELKGKRFSIVSGLVKLIYNILLYIILPYVYRTKIILLSSQYKLQVSLLLHEPLCNN